MAKRVKELTEEQLQQVINIKRLRKTFSKILPDIKINTNIVAFFCPTIPELVTYSIADGKLICRRNIATSIVEGLMQLECKRTFCNHVDEPALRKIKMGFDYINAEDQQSLDDPAFKTKIEELRAHAHKMLSRNDNG